jgi:hypothetical protein
LHFSRLASGRSKAFVQAHNQCGYDVPDLVEMSPARSRGPRTTALLRVISFLEKPHQIGHAGAIGCAVAKVVAKVVAKLVAKPGRRFDLVVIAGAPSCTRK